MNWRYAALTLLAVLAIWAPGFVLTILAFVVVYAAMLWLFEKVFGEKRPRP